MAEYKIIFKADQETEGDNALTWEPGCPALVTAIQVSRNTETSATYLQVKVHNVSDAAISSIFAGLEVSLPDGSIDKVPLEYLDADIAAGTEMALKPVTLSHSDISSCVLAISRIDQASGKWQTSAPAQPLPERKKLPYLSSRAIDQRARALNAEATDDILRGAVQDHGDWWVCACGQVNVSRHYCCACKQSKELLLANEDEAKLLAGAGALDERAYNEAVKLQNEGTLKTLKQAATKFESLGQYKEAKNHASACSAEIAILTSAKKKRTKTIIFIVCAVAAILAISGTVVTQVVIPLQERAAEEEKAVPEEEKEQHRVNQELETLSNIQIGETVEFGVYEQDNIMSNGKEPIAWRVLAVEDGKALLLAEKALDYIHEKPYESLSDPINDGETASMPKKSICCDFMDSAFPNSTERNLVSESPFLLSAEEVVQYIPNSEDRICLATDYAIAQGAEVLSEDRSYTDGTSLKKGPLFGGSNYPN